MKELVPFLLFLFVCLIIYFLFSYTPVREGLTDASGNTTTSSTSSTSSSTSSSSTSGVAGNAQTYASNIKNAFIKNQDILLISKYRTDYENVVINLDDYINSMMLQTTLSLDASNPQKGLDALTKLNDSKAALENVMKFIDHSQ